MSILTDKGSERVNYNETQGGVDSFNQMCQNMNAGRQTKRWPLCVFYNMINIASINAYIIMYVHYFTKEKDRDYKTCIAFTIQNTFARAVV